MAEEDTIENPATSRYEYGPEAKLDRDFESLTTKQRNTVEALVDLGPDARPVDVAEEAGIKSESYVYYVENHFPHIIAGRRSTAQVASDGGAPEYNVTLPAEEWWKAIRLLPQEISNDIFRQLRRE